MSRVYDSSFFAPRKLDQILPETYEAQPMYRICTQDGVCVLPYGLDEHVLKALKEVADKE
jgi:hypothetical protein